MDNKNDEFIKEDSGKSSSSKIRENFSMDDIQKLLVDIETTVSASKAEQIGIDPENMVKTIRGGRIVWISIDEMNAVLAKQRRITSGKKVQRNIRGENNLSNEITRRIDACRSFINAIRKVAPEESPEYIRSMRNLESLQNLSVSHAREVRVLEAAIQRKKQEDPILQEMDKATDDMMNALKEDALSDVDVCQSFCDRHMDEYLVRQKRIEPYINKAKEYRLSFLISKQQLYQLQYELIEKGQQSLYKHIEEIVYLDKEASYADLLVQNSNEIQSLVTENRPFFKKLSGLTPEELEDQKDLFIEADTKHLTPLFNKMICFTDLFTAAWNEIVEQKPANAPKISSSAKKQKETKRMVFGEKQKKS
jgi:hypothetical protein